MNGHRDDSLPWSSPSPAKLAAESREAVTGIRMMEKREMELVRKVRGSAKGKGEARRKLTIKLTNWRTCSWNF